MHTLRLPKPMERQILLLKSIKKYIAYGGSRGGGKSMGVRLKATILALAWAGIKILIARRTYPELIANHINPLKEMLHVGTKGAVARYNKTEKVMTFINGSTIKFDYCNADSDIDHYQGQEYDTIFVDEATQWKEEWLKKLNACLRGVNNFPKHVIYTCNPGGVSHGYIKRLFIDRKYIDGENPDDYEFIQSSVYDNKILLKTNPDYVKQLESLPPALKEAWLFGNWQIFEGAFFESFRERPDAEKIAEAGITEEEALIQRRWTHVIKPFDIPPDWKIYRGYDWGFGKPFAVCWFAQSPQGSSPLSDVLYMILELYGCTQTPNEGVKWTNKEQFDKIAEIEREHPWLKGKKIHGFADPSIWDGSHGISAAEEAEKHQLWFEPGINDRIPGWMQVRERMKFDQDGYAKLYFFENCKAIIRTMPLMMYDEHKVEDLDTSLEDHMADALRYVCMGRPIPPRIITEEEVHFFDPLNLYQKNFPGWGKYNQL